MQEFFHLIFPCAIFFLYFDLPPHKFSNVPSLNNVTKVTKACCMWLESIVLSLYWHSWLTILIEKGGFYNAGISFNHLQLFRLGTWVFQSTVLQTLGPDYLIHWVKIPSFLWSPRQRKMDPGAIVCEVTKSIVPAADQIRLLASAAKVHRRVCLFTVTGQQKICPEWSGLDS